MSWVFPPLYEKITEYRDKWKYICKGWNRLAFRNKPTNTVLLADETREHQEEDGRRRNYIGGRNRRFA
jgi:hypothetical protein